MPQRKSILQSEDVASSSPVRRSTRIANSPAPSSPVPATLTRRRSSASEATVPAKIRTVRRSSSSQDVEDRPQSQEIASGAANTPTKRKGRTSKKTDDVDDTAPETLSQARASSAEPQPKPRGRRPSLATLEVIDENEANKSESAKSARAARAARRGSIDSTTDKPDVPRPPSRRSMRGRSASIEIIEEPVKNVVKDLNPIHEAQEDIVIKTECQAMDETDEKAKNVDNEEIVFNLSDDDTIKDELLSPKSQLDENNDLRIEDKSAIRSIPEAQESERIDDNDTITIVDDDGDDNASEKSPKLKLAKQEISEMPPEKTDEKIIDITILEEAKELESEKIIDTDTITILEDDEEANKVKKSAAIEINETITILEHGKNLVEGSTEAESCKVPQTPIEKKSDNNDTITILDDDGDANEFENSQTHSVSSKQAEFAPTNVSSDENSEKMVDDGVITISDDNEDSVELEKSAKIETPLSQKSESGELSPQKIVKEDISGDAEKHFLENDNKSIEKVEDTSADKENIKIQGESEPKPDLPSKDSPIKSPRRSPRLSNSAEKVSEKQLLKSNEIVRNVDKTSNETQSVCTKTPPNSPNKRMLLSSSCSESIEGETKHVENSKTISLTKSPKGIKSPMAKINKQDSYEKSFDSDSVQFNVTIPSVPITSEDDQSLIMSHAEIDAINTSPGSDKENSNKDNIIESPTNKGKRLYLNANSTPKADGQEVDNAKKSHVEVTPSEKSDKALENKLNESINEVDNSTEFGTSPVKKVKQAENGNVSTKTDEDVENEMMDSFVDEVFQEDAKKMHNDTDVAVAEDSNVEMTKSSSMEIDELNTQDVKSNIEEVKESPSLMNIKPTEREEEKLEERAESEDKIIEEDNSLENAAISVKQQTAEKSAETSDIENKEVKSPQKSTALEAKTPKLAPIDYEEDSEDLVEEFLITEVSEGEEDTPSEDSNQIIDEGESLHSSDTEDSFELDEYDEDSFITDDDSSVALLSGNEEFDIYDEPPMKSGSKQQIVKGKKRTRIICFSDSSSLSGSEEETKDEASAKITADGKKKKISPTTISLKNTNVERQDKMPECPTKIKILQDITIVPQVPKEVGSSIVINEKDDLQSLENIGSALVDEVPKEPLPSLSTPNTSISEPTQRRSRHSSSLNIQEEVSMKDMKKGDINEKIARAVECFISSIKEKTGNVSLNVSLDYAKSPSPEARSASPTKRSSLQRDPQSSDINLVKQNRLSWTPKAEDRTCLEVALNTPLPLSDGETETASKNKKSSKKPKKEKGQKDASTTLSPALNVSLTLLENERKLTPKDSTNKLQTFDVKLVEENSQSKKKGKKRVLYDVDGATETNSKTTKDSKKAKKQTNEKQIEMGFNVKMESRELPKKAPGMEEPNKKSPTSNINKIAIQKGKKRKSPEHILIDSLPDVTIAKASNNTAKAAKKQKLQKQDSTSKILQNMQNVPETSSGKSQSDVINQESNTLIKKKKKDSPNVDANVNKTELQPVKKAAKMQTVQITAAQPSKMINSVHSKKNSPQMMNDKCAINDQDMLVEVETNACLTTFEIPTLEVKQNKKKFKPTKPVSADYSGWHVVSDSAQPSTKNKDKTESVKSQIQHLRENLMANDFKNQMIYDSRVRRTDSKKLIKNKRR